jgi:uncharacterized protein with PIN domain
MIDTVWDDELMVFLYIWHMGNKESVARTPPLHGSIKEVLAVYSRCFVCGGHLHFTHITDFNLNLTEETARCPECGGEPRKAMHRLQ